MYNKLQNACVLFIEVSNSITSVSNSFPNWKQKLPFLFYADHNILTSTILSSSLSVTLKDKLSIIVVKYSMNGTMLGHEPLTDQLFHFCSDQIRAKDQALITKIGYNTQFSCSYDLSTVFNDNTDDTNYDELIFYDPYLYIASANKYYPLPVYVENVDNKDGYKLVRRFFISDRYASNNQVFMYLKSASFKVTVYDKTKIYPPLIHIEYGVKQLSEMTDGDKYADISFEGSYRSSLSNFETSIIILFVITLILVLALWIYRVFQYQRMELIYYNMNMNSNIRSSQHTVDLVWFARIILVGFGISAHLFFWFLFFVSSYCYLAYKGQSKIQFLLPENTDSMMSAFKGLLTYCFLAKLLHVLMLIWDQCNVDVFFIDWEKPKGNIMALIQQQQFMQQQQEQHHRSRHGAFPMGPYGQPQQSWGMNMTYPNHPNPSPQSVQSNHTNANQASNHINSQNKTSDEFNIISCWRKLFIANEWNELSVHRNISPAFTFFIFLCFMVGFEYQYLSLQKPIASGSVNDEQLVPISDVYKFVLSAFFLGIIYCVEYLYSFFVHDRFCGSDPYIDLVDLASLANISIFILDLRYHGFYIHGKSVHQHADTSLEEINRNMENERKQLCKSRGLVANKDMFEIWVSTQFRQQYDEIYRDVLQFELNKLSEQAPKMPFDLSRFDPTNNNNNGTGNNNQQNTQQNEQYNILMSQQLIESSKVLSMFLCDFIEKCCPYKWELREPNGFERVFGPLPDLTTERNSLFYEDVMYRFKSTLMYVGLQYDLIILTILTFCFVDVMVLSEHNSIISILITYIIDYLLLAMRTYLGEKNVSRKTLIDEKFLI
eukprot:CAMPEP_0197030108 /NCGR_PEP_ID=MMETSP1384-20130603/9408_1 /TAXON_ID=29189 /ORGANISM="Ammonia sp." /LENGTH=829 /DNA_ID=CAMNT_0042459391 /DNA_START=606 /DNA_END=3095 /DNA_ORIENTATION=-